jgi:type I restriction enzyme M protein
LFRFRVILKFLPYRILEIDITYIIFPFILFEKENPSLKGVLPKDYARPSLDKRTLGELIDLIGTIGLGDPESKKKDILGRVYEYFLGEFADAESKKGGQFYTPRSIVRVLVEMLQPYKGRVYDCCCGSGGMFVQSEKFIEEHQGHVNDVSIFWQESNQRPGSWPPLPYLLRY